MTREEIKNIVRHVFHFYEVNAENCNWADMYEACGEILKALEQQPCEDCISREEVLEQINCWIGSGEYKYTNATCYLTRRMQDISSVTPQPKPGKWVEGEKTPGYIKWNCSECDLLVRNPQKPWYKYCPNCGAEMEV